MNGEKFLKLFGGIAALGAFGALFWLEKRRPLRRSVESKTIRTARNLTVAGIAAVGLQLIENPVVEPLTKLVERKNLGLLKFVRLPRWLETILAVVLLDYTLYIWHVLTHRVPFLWRFHVIHHTDLDLDASTALRFHIGELVISVAWRAAQIVFIGVTPLSHAAWQAFLFPSVLFHHSNVSISPELEEKLQWVFVTPRMHGIHHSIEQSETDSNWSSGLSVWDFLHRTLKTNIPQNEIIIGVSSHQNREEVVLSKILTMPFEEQKTARQLNEASSNRIE